MHCQANCKIILDKYALNGYKNLLLCYKSPFKLSSSWLFSILKLHYTPPLQETKVTIVAIQSNEIKIDVIIAQSKFFLNFRKLDEKHTTQFIIEPIIPSGLNTDKKVNISLVQK